MLPVQQPVEVKGRAMSMFAAVDNKLNELEEMASTINWMMIEEKKEEARRNHQGLSETCEEEALLQRLQSDNELILKEFEETEKKLENLRENPTASYLTEKGAFKKADAVNTKAEQRLQRRKSINDGIDAFFAKYNIGMGVVDDSDWKSIVLSQDNQEFILYFSNISAKFDSFHVDRVEPHFPEFYKLAEESNKSQDLLYLVMNARRYWKIK